MEWWSSTVEKWRRVGVLEFTRVDASGDERWSGAVRVLGSIADRLGVYTLDPEHFSAR